MKPHPHYWLRLLLKGSRLSARGFTLTELLVVAIVGSLIITGLLTLVIQLMTTDRHENVRLETNREMQMALDYMSNELREAVYVYTGNCLMNQADAGDVNLSCASPGIGNPNGNFLPNTGAGAIASNSDVPVLAFWKQQPIHPDVRARCTGPVLPPIDGIPVPCSTASSYALVVYSISTNPDGVWRGGARIKRYMLQEFNSANTRTPGYVAPSGNNDSINFEDWVPTARAGGTAAVLVDFVNNVPGPAAVSCPAGYSISPHPQALTAATQVADNLRSFYACIAPAGVGRNQDVQLFLQGNIAGRINGVAPDDGTLTTLQTRVMTRGLLNAR